MRMANMRAALRNKKTPSRKARSNIYYSPNHKISSLLRNLIRYFGDHHARRRQQFAPEHFSSLHVQRVINSLAGNKLGNNNGDRFIRLSAGKDFLDVIQQGFQKEPVGRIDNDKTRPSPPYLPYFADFLRILWIHRDVNRGK